MKVRIKFFAAPREALGRAEMEKELPAGATVRDLVEQLAKEHPALCRYVPSMNLAVNRQYVDLDSTLRDGDEVACVPPVAGG